MSGWIIFKSVFWLRLQFHLGSNKYFLGSVCVHFNSCVTCCCYKLLENTTIGHVKNKPTRDGVIHLLGVSIKKYNHLLGKSLGDPCDLWIWRLLMRSCPQSSFSLTLSGASVKVIQLLQHFEHLASVFAQAVAVWGKEYGVRTIVGEVLRSEHTSITEQNLPTVATSFFCIKILNLHYGYYREIGQRSGEELAREGSGVKAFSLFLSELATMVPDLIIPNISMLITHLEGEVTHTHTHLNTSTCSWKTVLLSWNSVPKSLVN